MVVKPSNHLKEPSMSLLVGTWKISNDSESGTPEVPTLLQFEATALKTTNAIDTLLQRIVQKRMPWDERSLCPSLSLVKRGNLFGFGSISKWESQQQKRLKVNHCRIKEVDPLSHTMW